ncbi:MAG: hypothetical protein COY58_06510 [Gammaproteobacteria bacterium CG_4_10_14_0_8_um_filter_38_16]|nr:MAG: hypothetical protein COY58_06510 [Gammaproteobacteria bacterium CG_4_10_14_0_8_um_filter_38_16]PJA02642.1 MAG: hypothetical protein COX72_09350 [Gammaproteobacteria bacterium CG_4_10_14_0_2_um_filter_38_22]PJB11098.1 MAG: hypothetical protein CO120_01500 [Gammaproteobacteria bacterium CG_4_9_14_3_um_filter_38_9]
MTFFLKKLISAFLLPLPFGLFWIALGIALLIGHRAARFRTASFIIGFFTIMLFAFNPISNCLLNSLQSRYTPLMTIPNGVTQVVVLGGGVSGGKNYPPNLTLNSASLSRLVEGIRLLKVLETTHPKAQLILSGGRVFRSPAVAGTMRNTAVMLGVNRKNTVLEDGSQDTRQEALFLQKTLGGNPFLLVTSAYHMPRAMDLFQDLGMHPIAAPTQYIRSQHDSLLWYIPNANSVVVSDIAIHEYLGLLWARIRGYIKK